ncbi:hypothetical protein CHLNCDRAFT_143861 [Chlorella variabilis]|uniref:Uncharacterized protein n=1 Tax=Chlorella variabilis TaxID=554065 RepID=E1ZAL6_CHLVA|nr:hypothetical protein CHLNCDRAFT_143861 [Chlorella variabilis]EFN57084.1 hypothetical protein CHLNCDRAFT_143861 [Chlorella variabilis]|eukprot:XP_005849186.1 hypothetical protein CHLNCDRAFT_143861 [Chlorella variabilis]
MSDAEDTSIIKFEQAKSGRSTCRATGELIGQGEWRVGFDTFISGRVATAWMKPLPFLRDCCRLEYCLNPGSQGACKATRRKFEKGEVRFVCTAGDPQKKIYLSVAAAGDELAPVLQHVGRRAFSPTQVGGLEDLAAEDRRRFCQAFGVASAEAAKFDKRHPAPERPLLDKPAAAAKASVDRPAKRARGAAAAAGSAVEAEEAGQEGAGSDGATGLAAEEQGLTEYEQQRLEHIKRNRERMMALNLPALASELVPPPKAHAPTAKHKGVSRKRLSEVLPRRESSRLRGIAADGSQVHSERQGEVVVVAGEVIRRYAPGGGMEEEREPQERHPHGELVFESSNCGRDTDEAFIQLLAHAAASANSGSGGSGGGAKGKGKGKGGTPAKPMGVADMARLSLAADDVAKVTKDATTHLAWHPTTDTLIVACADKKGHVGLWHVSEGSYELPPSARRSQPILRHAPKQEQQEEEQQEQAEGSADAKPAATGAATVSLDAAGSAAAGPAAAGGEPSSASASEAFDGVVSLQAQHYQYICGLRWAGGSGRGAALFTASYDGSLRRLDVQRGVSDLVVSSEEDEYSCMDVTGDGWTALLGDNEGALRLVDVRAGRVQGRPLTVHRKKINTVHLEPTQEQVCATSSTDTSIQLWDMRKLAPGKPLAAAGHAQGCQAAMFAPDGSRRLVSTSFDNTLRIWDGASGLAPLRTIKHDNNTGRWVLPFRAVWNAAGDGVIVGNMKRFVDVFDASSGAMAAQLHSEHMTAIASRNAVHPALPVLACATNSGRIHVYR